jgi:WD40 repeat protein
VGGLAFNADGSKILSSSPDKTVRVWETETGRELQKFTGHTEMIRRAVFHPDGKHALSAGRDGFVRMWEIDTAKEVKRFKSPGNWAECLAVSKDGKFLAIGGKPSVVFDIETGKRVSEFSGHPFGATDLTFSDDGKRVLSCGYDGTARLWDRNAGQELYIFRSHREFLWMAAFSPDGKWVLTGGGGFSEGNGKYNKGTDHTIRLWKMPDEKAIAEFSSEN